MARLNNLCIEIAGVYQHGAEITIATDGLVFNGEQVFLAIQVDQSLIIEKRYCRHHRRGHLGVQ